METELISLSNQTPFDDRPNHKATLDDLSFILIRDYLVKVKVDWLRDCLIIL